MSVQRTSASVLGALVFSALVAVAGVISWVHSDGAAGASEIVTMSSTNDTNQTGIIETEASVINAEQTSVPWDFTYSSTNGLVFLIKGTRQIETSDTEYHRPLTLLSAVRIWTAREIALFVATPGRFSDMPAFQERFRAGYIASRSYIIPKDPMTGVSVAPDMSQILFVRNGRVMRMSMTLRDGYPAMDRVTDLGPDFARCDPEQLQVVSAVSIGTWLPGCKTERGGIRFALDRGTAGIEARLVARPADARNARAVMASIGGPVFWVNGRPSSDHLEIFPPGTDTPLRFTADPLTRTTAWSAQDCTADLWTDATPDQAAASSPILTQSIEGWSRIRVNICAQKARPDDASSTARPSFLESVLNYSNSIVAAGHADQALASPIFVPCNETRQGCAVQAAYNAENKLALLWRPRDLAARTDAAVWFPGGPFTKLEELLYRLDLPELHWSAPKARPAMFVAIGPESFSGTVADRAALAPDPHKRAAALRDMLDQQRGPDRQDQALAMIAGDSFGGLTASSFALTYPKLAKRLVLVGPGNSDSIMLPERAFVQGFVSGEPSVPALAALFRKASAPFESYIARMASEAPAGNKIAEVCALRAKDDDVVDEEQLEWYRYFLSKSAKQLNFQTPELGGHGFGAARACI